MPKKNHKITIEDLAVMVKNGFNGVDEQLKEIKDSADKKFEGVNENLKGLAEGQERIELRLSNAAYRFEVYPVK